MTKFIGNSHYYKEFGTKVIDGNIPCAKYEPNHQWFSLCQIWYKSPMRGDFFHIWYNEIWVQKKNTTHWGFVSYLVQWNLSPEIKYHSLVICLIFGTMKSKSRKKNTTHWWFVSYLRQVLQLTQIWDLKKFIKKITKILLIGDLYYIWYNEKFY